jgi:hypothetical protein
MLIVESLLILGGYGHDDHGKEADDGGVLLLKLLGYGGHDEHGDSGGKGHDDHYRTGAGATVGTGPGHDFGSKQEGIPLKEVGGDVEIGGSGAGDIVPYSGATNYQSPTTGNYQSSSGGNYQSSSSTGAVRNYQSSSSGIGGGENGSYQSSSGAGGYQSHHHGVSGSGTEVLPSASLLQSAQKRAEQSKKSENIQRRPHRRRLRIRKQPQKQAPTRGSGDDGFSGVFDFPKFSQF